MCYSDCIVPHIMMKINIYKYIFSHCTDKGQIPYLFSIQSSLVLYRNKRRSIVLQAAILELAL